MQEETQIYCISRGRKELTEVEGGKEDGKSEDHGNDMLKLIELVQICQRTYGLGMDKYFLPAFNCRNSKAQKIKHKKYMISTQTYMTA